MRLRMNYRTMDIFNGYGSLYYPYQLQYEISRDEQGLH